MHGETLKYISTYFGLQVEPSLMTVVATNKTCWNIV